MTKINKIQNHIVADANKIFTEAYDSKEVLMSIKDYVKKHYKKLLEEGMPRVSEYGDFDKVYEIFENPDKTLGASHFVMRIVKPPVGVENHQKIRNLELVALKEPSPYKSTVIIATGTKDELLKKMQKENMCDEISEAFRSLSKGLDDI